MKHLTAQRFYYYNSLCGLQDFHLDLVPFNQSWFKPQGDDFNRAAHDVAKGSAIKN